MQVTDAMVEAACRANIHPDTDPSDTERRHMRAALKAALSQGQHGEVASAEEIVRTAFQATRANTWLSNPTIKALYDDLVDGIRGAIAAAQADYEARIRSALAAPTLTTCYECDGPLNGPYCPACSSPAQEAGAEPVGYELGIRACVDELKKLRDSYPANQHAPTVTVRKALSEAIQQLAHLPATPPAGGGQAVAQPVRLRFGDYPIGTKAFSINGGHWTRVKDGWKWHCGDTFPHPGGDAYQVELPALTAAAPYMVPEAEALTLDEDELDTIEIIGRNEQSGRVTNYEIKELVRVYRAVMATSPNQGGGDGG